MGGRKPFWQPNFDKYFIFLRLHETEKVLYTILRMPLTAAPPSNVPLCVTHVGRKAS